MAAGSMIQRPKADVDPRRARVSHYGESSNPFWAAGQAVRPCLRRPGRGYRNLHTGLSIRSYLIPSR
jgi:hypothetical protein